MTNNHKRSAVFLDRDGVINVGTSGYVTCWDEFHFAEGSVEAIVEIHKAGHPIYVVTNQSGIARGLYTQGAVDDIHTRMLDAIRQKGGDIDGVYVCPHAPDDNCDCRKPKSGLLLQAVQEHGAETQNAWMVGDKPRDLEAGKRVGCRAIYIEDGTDHHFTFSEKNSPDFTCSLLIDAVPTILAENLSENEQAD